MHRVDIHAFHLGADTKAAVEQALADRRLAKIRPTFFAGSIADAARKYEGEPSPGLLIVETRDLAQALFEQLDRLSAVCRTGTELILLGAHNDVALYRQLARRGVHEYLPAPIEPGHLMEAVLAVCADPEETRQGRLISVIGASGGAGSSTIANNLARQLGKIYDDETVLVDFDLAFGTIGLDFNLDSPQTAAHALAQADRLDDQMLDRFLVRPNDNLALLTAPGDGDTPADIDPAALDQLIKMLRRNAAWVVADLPHYWGGWVRHMLDASDEIVMTAVPTLASLRNAKSAADMLNTRRKHDTPVRVVLNRVGASPKTDIPTRDFSSTLGGPPAALVPYEPALFIHAANTGNPIAASARGQRVMEPLRRLAVQVSGRPAVERRQRGSASDLWQKIAAWSVSPLGRAAT